MMHKENILNISNKFLFSVFIPYYFPGQNIGQSLIEEAAKSV